MAIGIEIENLSAVLKGLDEKEKNLGKAVDAATKTFKRNGFGWVEKAISGQEGAYTIAKKDVTATRAGTSTNGSVKINGVTMENVQLRWQGRTLTPTHFAMKPKTPRKKAYTVSMQVKKAGGRKNLPEQAFLGTNKGSGYIPFMRTGASAYPIKAIKTVSVPQMITGEDASPKVIELVNDKLEAELARQLARFNK